MDVADWQEWTVGLVLAICAAFILYKTYKMVRCIKLKDNPCEQCTAICILKKRKKLPR